MKKILIALLVFYLAGITSCRRNDEKEKTEITETTTVSSTTTTSTVSLPTEIITLATTPLPETTPSGTAENPVVLTAEALMGIEFAHGGASPSEGFDNSGFIYYVLRENGYISCPRQISEQLEWGENTDYDSLKAGDVAYFSDEPGGDASFGGIYAGNGIMIYSPYPGETVKTADITAEYWKSRFVTALSL